MGSSSHWHWGGVVPAYSPTFYVLTFQSETAGNFHMLTRFSGCETNLLPVRFRLAADNYDPYMWRSSDVLAGLFVIVYQSE